MITIKLSAEPTSITADMIQMGECFILADEEAGKEVYMHIHNDLKNVYNSGIYVRNDVYKQYIPLQNEVICVQLETGLTFAFDKNERVIPVSGIFRWRENDGIKS